MTSRDASDAAEARARARARAREVEASDELRVMVRPFHAYRALAEDASIDRGRWWWRPLITLVFLGAFGSVSTAGRFVFAHMVLVALAWSFVPAAQLLWLAAAHRRWGRTRRLDDSVHLFFAGQGGWLALIVLVLALLTLAPGVADALTGAAWVRWLGGGALVTALHGVVVTYAFMREVWALPRRRAWAAAGAYYLGLTGTFVTYYLAMGQLLPLLVRPQ